MAGAAGFSLSVIVGADMPKERICLIEPPRLSAFTKRNISSMFSNICFRSTFSESNAPLFARRFERFLIEILMLDAAEKILKVLERAAARAFFYDCARNLRADVLDGEQSEADLWSFRREVDETAVDVRRQDFHARCFASWIRNEIRSMSFISALSTRGSEFFRIVRLKVRGAVSDHRVARGVRSIESIARERLDEFPCLIGDLLRDVVL